VWTAFLIRFFTTKRWVEGTGLGLSDGAIHHHGLRRLLSALSTQLGRGTTFHVYFP